MARERAIVIGVGTPCRGDDGAGPAVADMVRGRAGVTVVPAPGDGLALMEAWDDAGTVVVVDAVASGSRPGTIHRFDAGAEPLPALWFRGSTHAIGVAEAVEMGRALGRLPRRLIVLGIEGAGFAPGAGLSPEVTAVLARAAQLVLDEAGTEG